jgi:hypothetical protein
MMPSSIAGEKGRSRQFFASLNFVQERSGVRTAVYLRSCPGRIHKRLVKWCPPDRDRHCRPYRDSLGFFSFDPLHFALLTSILYSMARSRCQNQNPACFFPVLSAAAWEMATRAKEKCQPAASGQRTTPRIISNVAVIVPNFCAQIRLTAISLQCDASGPLF